MSVSPIDYTLYDGENSDIPPKKIGKVIDFFKENQELIDGYYGINRDGTNATLDSSKEKYTTTEFRKLIKDAAKNFFK